MEKATYDIMNNTFHLVLRQDGAHASLPNGLGRAHSLPLWDTLDRAGLQEMEDAHAVIGFANGLVADGTGHFGYEAFPVLRCVRFNS